MVAVAVVSSNVGAVVEVMQCTVAGAESRLEAAEATRNLA